MSKHYVDTDYMSELAELTIKVAPELTVQPVKGFRQRWSVLRGKTAPQVALKQSLWFNGQLMYWSAGEGHIDIDGIYVDADWLRRVIAQAQAAEA